MREAVDDVGEARPRGDFAAFAGFGQVVAAVLDAGDHEGGGWSAADEAIGELPGFEVDVFDEGGGEAGGDLDKDVVDGSCEDRA